MSEIKNFPRQQLSFKSKTKAWRKKCVDFADDNSYTGSSIIRKNVRHKKINYDLVTGKVHMDDLMSLLNPEDAKKKYIPTNIQHYPIINTKLQVLWGEESKRSFDYKVVVTNPNAISQIEENKRDAILQMLQQELQNESQDEEEFTQKMQKYSDYFNYEWQDLLEVRANCLLKHYSMEQNMQNIFSEGFKDATIIAEEMYKCDIIGGEPHLEKLNPNKVRVYRSGYSNRIEDADFIVIEDYWSPGKVIDTFYDVLTAKDMKYLEEHSNFDKGAVDSMGGVDPTYEFMKVLPEGALHIDNEFFWNPVNDDVPTTLDPFDSEGNVRVLQVYWKSRRKIKKVKSYDQMTGEPVFTFYPETYVLREDLGEEEEIYWINEAWEGTKIGKDIYVNMRPRLVQYNSLSNPSRCHFGIIGQIYNINDGKPLSLVDMMKPYNYLYDVIHARLNRLIARNRGRLLTLDFAKVPKGWDVQKWMYFVDSEGINVIDSFNEGVKGAATGKLAGGLNNASTGVIDAELGNTIQQYTNLLEFIKLEMSDVAGISKQREGQIANRETVGGVERATLQSSYITEWWFTLHSDVKRRVLECFLETAKIALRGKNKKFQYLLPNLTTKIMEVDGDEFSNNDYGLVVDDSNGTQELNQKIDMLAQAALQNQMINFSTLLNMYTSASLSEKIRMIQKNEQELMQQRQQQQEEAMQMQQAQMEQQSQMEQSKMQLQDSLNERDNETKIIVAEINANAKQEDFEPKDNSEEAREKLMESMRQFDERLKLDRERLAFDKSKARTDAELKRKQINKLTPSAKK